VLDREELASVSALFGVSEDQVVKDHLISHVLHALARSGQPVTFFGGTALHRRHFPSPETGGRLSEDIDLCALDRRPVAEALDGELPRLLRREFPGSAWDPGLARVAASAPASLVTGDGVRVRIQLLAFADHRDYLKLPTEVRPVEMRYRDVPATELNVPTLAAFAAMKTCAWIDRRAARDLYDLAALARRGALNADAAALVNEVIGYPVAPHFFDRVGDLNWQRELAHQMPALPPMRTCLAGVRAAYGDTLGWEQRGDALG